MEKAGGGDGFGLPGLVLPITAVRASNRRALAAALAERQSVTVARGIETSVSFLPLVFTALVFGPLAARAVAGLVESHGSSGPQ